ncbi:MAG: hypothetical protein GPJ15_12735, partial [Microcystis aeruginosa G11-06]|nr:hypothetical protein [Microcystis aeruginosa G11-06]
GLIIAEVVDGIVCRNWRSVSSSSVQYSLGVASISEISNSREIGDRLEEFTTDTTHKLKAIFQF